MRKLTIFGKKPISNVFALDPELDKLQGRYVATLQQRSIHYEKSQAFYQKRIFSKPHARSTAG